MIRSQSVLLVLFGFLCGTAVQGQSLVRRLNAGGPTVTDELGQVWSADQAYSPGGSGYVAGSALPKLSGFGPAVVGGQTNPMKAVLSTSRVAWSAYRFDVPNGTYIVRLTLAEIWNQGPNLRSMDVSLEGAPFLADLDLAQELGIQYGGQVSALVVVSDGRLDVEAAPGPGGDPSSDAPIVCGIEVWSAPPVFPAAPVVNGLVARPSYGRNLLTWDWEDDPNLAGWRIWRAETFVGPPPHAPGTLSSGRNWVELGDVWAAPARFHDDAVLSGHTYSYRVAALGLGGNVGPRSAAVSATVLHGAETALPRYQVSLSAEDQLFIDENILLQPNEEVPATFTFEGDSRPAEVRYRGNTARTLSKKSWAIKFASSEAFQGRRDLNLKASFIDPGLVREEVGGQLFEAVGVAAFAVRPVHLEVNGVYLGVFNEAEEIDESFLAVRDRDTGGDIFKSESDMTVLATPEMYEVEYEKETNESTGHAALIEFIEFLSAPPTPSFVADLADIFDVDAYLSYLAVTAWTANRDSVFHNYYLHQDLSLDRWEVLPWDTDISLGIPVTGLNLSILFGTGAGGEAVNQLRARLLAEPVLLWRYCQKLSELEARFANPAWLNPRIVAASEERRADAHADPYKLGWESEVRFEADAVAMQSFAALRTPIVDAEVAAVQPATPPTVVWINELAATTQTAAFDEQGEFEDWIELHNASAGPVDVGGMYLTDDLSDATQWQIPPATVIPAFGHLLVWCDDEAGDGPLHANFKLSASGEELGLFDTDGTTLLDFQSWNRQYPELSYGRYQDAGQFFQLLAIPTPGLANTEAGNLPPVLTWVSANPGNPGDTDAVAITCSSVDPDGLAAVELHWQADGGGYATVPMAALGADRFGASIPPQPEGTLVEYFIRSTDIHARASEKPAEGAGAPSSYVVADDGLSALRVNELMASNTTTVQDEFGDFEDWIEIHNTSASAIDMGGMFLSDDLGNSTKWQVPPGTIIPANGYLLFWADDEAGEGPLHAAFKLGAGGEDAALFDTLAAGNGLLDNASFGPQTANVSFGHLPNGATFRYLLSTASPGASNLPAPGATLVYEYKDSAVNPIALAPQGPATVGGAIAVTVSNAPPSQSGSFYISQSPNELLFPGIGYSLVGPVVGSVGIAIDGSGNASASIDVPSDAGLIGVPVYSQAFVAGGGFSNGVVFTVGP